MLVSQRINRLEIELTIPARPIVEPSGSICYYPRSEARDKITYWLFLVQKYTENSLQAHAFQSAYSEQEVFIVKGLRYH